ncbi:MAG: hypothetical protein AAGD25_18120 [Cyanobacteria bacterium P01_F01_bin.150]
MVMRSGSGWDLAVKNRDGQLVLVVEVKRRTKVSPEWAAQLRRNILAHGIFADAPYFLLVFPDQFYLWASNKESEFQHERPYIIDSSPILQPYLDRADISPEQISETGLELIITSWLGEIIYAEELPEQLDASQQWLLESGFYAALMGGQLEHEVAA